ncbi:hypothetical protein THAOC_13217, partial [Thalassiosira oceanica]
MRARGCADGANAALALATLSVFGKYPNTVHPACANWLGILFSRLARAVASSSRRKATQRRMQRGRWEVGTLAGAAISMAPVLRRKEPTMAPTTRPRPSVSFTALILLECAIAVCSFSLVRPAHRRAAPICASASGASTISPSSAETAEEQDLGTLQS